MSKNSDRVMKWRHNCKRKILEAFQLKCGCCGYDKCEKALEFHHLDPSEKGDDFKGSNLMGRTRAWKDIVREMHKCVMLCANCHREVHAGVREIPADIPRFDESLIK